MTSGDDELSNSTEGAGNIPVVDTLEGIPGIGPARRSALTAAGITTAESLHALGAAELARLTRMPRAQADRIIESLSEEAEASAPVVETPPPPPPSEVVSDEPATVETVEAAVPPVAEPTPSPTEDDPGIMRVRAAANALARRKGFGRLARPFARLHLLLDDLSGKTAVWTPKQKKRLRERLTDVAARLEKVAGHDKPLTPKAEKRFRERLREDRRTIAEMLARRSRRTTEKATDKDAGPAKKKKS